MDQAGEMVGTCPPELWRRSVSCCGRHGTLAGKPLLNWADIVHRVCTEETQRGAPALDRDPPAPPPSAAGLSLRSMSHILSGDVTIVRSARRQKTVSAYREGGRTFVVLPAWLSAAEEAQWVLEMTSRLERQERRRRPGDVDLAARARALSDRYLGGQACPADVRWVTNQRGRWGSATPLDGTIRLSHRLRGMPDWVVDYVLLHELAHLIEPSHGPRFWKLLAGYPKLERARGYLEGVATAAGWSLADW